MPALFHDIHKTETDYACKSKRDDKKAVSSIAIVRAPRAVQVPLVSSEGRTHVLDSQEWRVIPIYWSSKAIHERFGRQDSYRVEIPRGPGFV